MLQSRCAGREESDKIVTDLLSKKVGFVRGAAGFLRANLQITRIKYVKNYILDLRANRKSILIYFGTPRKKFKHLIEGLRATWAQIKCPGRLQRTLSVLQ